MVIFFCKGSKHGEMLKGRWNCCLKYTFWISDAFELHEQNIELQKKLQ